MRSAAMGLYLCVFNEEGDDEHAASEVGSYADFGAFRQAVARHLVGSDFPVLLLHSDCDGEWTVEELPALIKELDVIAAAFDRLPRALYVASSDPAVSVPPQASTLCECYVDVQGDKLVDALRHLARTGIEFNRPISFN
jgi:hypothetical protein